jgi:hypothetical protein
MSSSDKASPFSLQVFITLTLICLISITLYYLHIAHNLIPLLRTYSPSESSIAWFILKDLRLENIDWSEASSISSNALSKSSVWESFSESSIYANFLLTILRLLGKEQNLNSILLTGRSISLLSLIAILFSFFAILYREKIRPALALIACILFLSATSIQFFSFQALPELPALAIGLIGTLIWTYKRVNKTQNNSLNFLTILFCALCFALAYLFCPKLSFLCFGFAYFFQSLRLKSMFQSSAVLLPLIASIGIELSLRKSLFPLSLPQGWNFNLFLSNFSVIETWALFVAIASIVFLNRYIASPTQLSSKSASSKILLLSFVFCVFETGLQPDCEGSWMIFILAACWSIAISLNDLWTQIEYKTILILNILLLSLTLFTSLVVPSTLQTIRNNPQLMTVNRQLILQERKAQSKNLSFKKRNQKKIKVLSQDLILALKLGYQPYFNNPNLFYYSKESTDKALSIIEKKKFDRIILSEYPERYFPARLVSAIKQHYAKEESILVNGDKGGLYYSKEYLGKNDSPNSIHASGSGYTFATFHYV